MIKARFMQRADEIVGFELSGHAGYAESGEDIVCAAVTSAVQLAANAITEIIGIDAAVNVDENLISLRLPADGIEDSAGYAAQVTLSALRLHLEILAEQYEGTIKVRIMEVK